MHKGIESWKNLLIFAYNLFSIPLLLGTLFSPWQNDTSQGSNFGIFEKIVFAIFSRVMGLVARLVLIACGLVFTFIIFLSFPLFFFIPIHISKEGLQNMGSIGASLSYGNTFTLNKHGKDAGVFGFSKIYGKDKALRMIERALSKDTNRNVLLVGETGVGKSAIINEIGRLAQSGLSYESIRRHRVVTLQVEGISMEDFDKSLHEAKRAGNVILAIENIHLYPALYERLMPYLDMKNLALLTTTDFANYDQVLKSYPEFLSKFEKINIEPTNTEDTIAILRDKVAQKRIKINQDALLEIVRLSDRFIGNQPEPLKALLVLEELIGRDKRITVEDVQQIISDKTNMPIGSLGQDERAVLLGIEEKMKAKVIGQDEAVTDVAEALKRLRTGISDPSKPAGGFLFLGPTGVGKTYTAKILAESYFGRKDAMIRFDMSEFSLPESVNIFSDRLASVIEEAPLSLVFFDELEKAHKTIHQLLLQVLDEGRLTRTSGRTVSFKDAIIIATTNAGSKLIIENPHVDRKEMLDYLIKNNLFSPEFLNRFSSIILFGPLDQEEIKKVTSLLLLEFKERLLADKGITLEITDDLINKVASSGFDPEFGARPIKRAIEEIVENKVAEYIIEGNVGGSIKI